MDLLICSACQWWMGVIQKQLSSCTVCHLCLSSLNGSPVDESSRPPPIWSRTALPEPPDQTKSQAPTMDPWIGRDAHGPVPELGRTWHGGGEAASQTTFGLFRSNFITEVDLTPFQRSPELISPHGSMLRRPSADGTGTGRRGRPAPNSRFTHCQFKHPQTRAHNSRE